MENMHYKNGDRTFIINKYNPGIIIDKDTEVKFNLPVHVTNKYTFEFSWDRAEENRTELQVMEAMTLFQDEWFKAIYKIKHLKSINEPISHNLQKCYDDMKRFYYEEKAKLKEIIKKLEESE